MDLSEYATTHARTRKCWLCERPEIREAVAKGREDGITFSLIWGWLKEVHDYPYGQGQPRHCLVNHGSD